MLPSVCTVSKKKIHWVFLNHKQNIVKKKETSKTINSSVVRMDEGHRRTLNGNNLKSKPRSSRVWVFGIIVIMIASLSVLIVRYSSQEIHRYPAPFLANIKSQVALISQRYVSANESRHNPVLALLYADEAVNGWQSLRNLLSEKEIIRLTHIHPHEMQARLLHQQQELVQQIMKQLHPETKTNESKSGSDTINPLSLGTNLDFKASHVPTDLPGMTRSHMFPPLSLAHTTGLGSTHIRNNDKPIPTDTTTVTVDKTTASTDSAVISALQQEQVSPVGYWNQLHSYYDQVYQTELKKRIKDLPSTVAVHPKHSATSLSLDSTDVSPTFDSNNNNNTFVLLSHSPERQSSFASLPVSTSPFEPFEPLSSTPTDHGHRSIDDGEKEQGDDEEEGYYEHDDVGELRTNNNTSSHSKRHGRKKHQRQNHETNKYKNTHQRTEEEEKKEENTGPAKRTERENSSSCRPSRRILRNNIHLRASNTERKIARESDNETTGESEAETDLDIHIQLEHGNNTIISQTIDKDQKTEQTTVSVSSPHLATSTDWIRPFSFTPSNKRTDSDEKSQTNDSRFPPPPEPKRQRTSPVLLHGTTTTPTVTPNKKHEPTQQQHVVEESVSVVHSPMATINRSSSVLSGPDAHFEDAKPNHFNVHSNNKLITFPKETPWRTTSGLQTDVKSNDVVSASPKIEIVPAPSIHPVTSMSHPQPFLFSSSQINITPTMQTPSKVQSVSTPQIMLHNQKSPLEIALPEDVDDEWNNTAATKIQEEGEKEEEEDKVGEEEEESDQESQQNELLRLAFRRGLDLH